MIVDSTITAQRLRMIKRQFPFTSVFEIGHSAEGRPIYALNIGSQSDSVLYAGSFHALEWITGALLLNFAEALCTAIKNETLIAGIDISSTIFEKGLCLIPLVNPDGVERVLHADGEALCWQANANGVDINHNFDAGWEILHTLEQEAGITGPGPTRYGGPCPESEPETQALCALCRTRYFRYAFAFHSQGEEIYWDYPPYTPPKAHLIGKILSVTSGYTLDSPVELASHGGFKDWFIKNFNRPAFTIEVGKGKNPLPISQLDKIYGDLLEMLTVGMIL